MVENLTVKEGDYSYYINFTLQEADETALDLTDASSIKFKVKDTDASSLKVDGTCSVVNATSGTCRYLVQSGDFDTENDYKAEVEVTYTSGKVLTTKTFYVFVKEDL